ncbi:2-hydroxychromene-2-carboxylate isomerase [Massilia sp. CF038]|uniref:2-hydroxychromene-2-carboxylate isomerase n=1 Tax=Massilia sp. CF038 TaxID=1881045 RepID=UPI00090F2C15|nr:2-hydroxychromene-2-carboxylate isomerase [Massilia sp. CF038]SHG95364.1 2-hydroxychromene-2-carboxylate isomerase [Massilia sp. CF038]
MTVPTPIHFWYDFGSNYSYLSVMRIEATAAKRGVPVVWRPFLLGPIFQAFGWDNSPFVLQKEKGAYVWNDMAREGKKYGLPFRRPSTFPRTAVQASRVALLGADAGWGGEYSRRIMLLNFALDQDIGSDTLVFAVLQDMGLPAQELMAAARADEVKARLRDQVAEAHRLGVFGAPTFFVGSEMFWGNDRLDDAIRFAAAAAAPAAS